MLGRPLIILYGNNVSYSISLDHFSFDVLYDTVLVFINLLISAFNLLSEKDPKILLDYVSC